MFKVAKTNLKKYGFPLRKYTTTFERVDELPKREWYELQIPMPWGHLRGKWWGPLDARPIVAWHGWQENCGSFERLAPLLPDHISLLALDAVGQGLSSPYPNGINYTIYDEPIILRKLTQLFEWNRVSLLLHSQANMKGFIFAAMYPQWVDFLVGIDIMYPFTVDNMPDMWSLYGQRVDQFWTNVDKLAKNVENQTYTYTYDECLRKIIDASNRSLTEQYAPYILKRAIRPSKIDPNRYYFARDLRLRTLYVPSVLRDECLHMIRHITCPILSIRTKNTVLEIDENYCREIMDVLRKSCDAFEQIEVVASHHVHLITPELVIEPIATFIQKYYDANHRHQRRHVVEQFIIEPASRRLTKSHI